MSVNHHHLSSDQFMSTNSVEQSPSSGFCPSSSTTSSNEKYTREKIQYLLKHNKTQYVVLDNSTNNSSSICWRLFGFPAKLDVNGVPQKIKNFSFMQKLLYYLFLCFKQHYLYSKSLVVSLHGLTNKFFFIFNSHFVRLGSKSLITVYGHPKTDSTT